MSITQGLPISRPNKVESICATPYMTSSTISCSHAGLSGLSKLVIINRARRLAVKARVSRLAVEYFRSHIPVALRARARNPTPFPS